MYALKALTPACAISNKIKAKAVKINSTRPKDILDAQAAHKAAGTDMALMSSNRYFYEQWNLIGYRVERLYLEVEAVVGGAYFNKSYKIKNFIFDLRTCTHILFAYLLSNMLGRNSVFPLIEPGSPLEMAARTRANPN